MRHFRHFLEVREFHVLTDHKPLTHAISAQPDRYSPWEICHQDFIDLLTSKIFHINGYNNIIADALSHNVMSIQRSAKIDFELLAKMQYNDDELQELLE